MADNVFVRPEFIHVFTNEEGEQWMYDYNRLKLTQINVAAELFEFHYQRKVHPPAREADLKVGNGHLLMRSCFSYCLIPLDKESEPLPFVFEEMEKRAGEAARFLDTLGGEHQAMLERCRKDFFLGPNELSLLESALRSSRFIQDTRREMLKLMEDMQGNVEPTRKDLQNSENSTSPAPTTSG